MRRQPDIEEKMRAAFETDRIGKQRELELENMLTSLTSGKEVKAIRAPRIWFGAVGWGLAAALLTAMGIQRLFPDAGMSWLKPSQDPSTLTELTTTSQHDQRVLELTGLYPADFEIEDEQQGLEPIVRSYLGDSAHDFEPSVPEHILASYVPSKGRLLTWHGNPAISVSLKPREAAATMESESESEDVPLENARLFIIHTPNAGRSFFDTMPTNVPTPFAWRASGSSSNTPQYGRIWRDGSSTYIVVGEGYDE